MSKFKELLQKSMKSTDTEEWLDVHFTRPIGLLFALMWHRLGVSPNAITILSIFLGVGAAWMFAHVDVLHNLCGVLLLMSANFCDSTDGQLARLTGQTSFLGRVLDGFSGDVWFLCIYVALSLRLQGQPIPATDVPWGWGVWLLAIVAGAHCHAHQSSLADYYRQIHLFFLKGKAGSELATYAQERAHYCSLPRTAWLARVFFYNYANYCRSQEHRTPAFQAFFARYMEHVDAVRQPFLAGSRPLMAYANILTFNTRAIVLYVTCVTGCPWLYLLSEVTVFHLLYLYMRHRHEGLCRSLMDIKDSTI